MNKMDLKCIKYLPSIGASALLLIGTLLPIQSLQAQDPGNITATSTQENGGGTGVSAGNPFSSVLNQILTSLNNFGTYMGYDLTTTNPITPKPTTLLDLTLAQIKLFEASAPTFFMNTLFPAIGYTGQASTGGGQQGAGNTILPVEPVIDQKPYLADPVSQGILNMLSTYDYSFCYNSNYSRIMPKNGLLAGLPAAFANCNQFNQSTIAQNVVNPPTGISATAEPTSISSYGYLFLPSASSTDPQLSLIPQLNSNSLLAPMLYSTQAMQNPGPASSGLQAANQAEQAANFIRYSSNAVAPGDLIDFNAFSKLSAGTINTADPISAARARSKLASYFASLRGYAAQTSVGTGNLYYMLNKRMPQCPGSGGSASTECTTKTSEALNEYAMATWRIHDPASDQNSAANPADNSSGAGAAKNNDQTWQAKINQASSKTVEKEMAILLAEINYQLYLSRQQQERLLLTNTMLLFQLSRMNAPTPPQPPGEQ